MDGLYTAADADALSRGCYFDLRYAERVRQFFRTFLRHSKGEWAGQPFDPLSWQWERVLKPVFGWRRADGTRRYRRVYVEIPKKNGKSTLAAGLALYLMLADGEPGAEVYSAAADRKQASIVFDETVQMVRQSPLLDSRISLVKSLKRMRVESTGSSYEALSADVATKHGFNIHGLIFDELHVQKTRKMWETLEYGGAARRQPLLVAITTAGDDKDSICWEQHEYALALMNGDHVDPSYYGVIFAADPVDDWKAEATWHKANPSLGTALKLDQFADDCRAAQYKPAAETAFKRLRLNIWSDGSADRWLDLDSWDACKAPIDPQSLLGQPCYAGVDLSATTDLAAVALYFPHVSALLAWFWTPSENAKQRERQNKPRIDQWIKSGHIKVIDGAYIQQDVIINYIDQLHRQYKLKDVAIDPWNGYDFAIRLRNKGVHCTLFKQGYPTISAPTKRLAEMVLALEVRHDGNPVLRWCVQNCVVDTDASENIKPTKRKSIDRIDGVVAAIMAIGSAPAKKTSVYDRGGLKVIG